MRHRSEPAKRVDALETALFPGEARLDAKVAIANSYKAEDLAGHVLATVHERRAGVDGRLGTVGFDRLTLTAKPRAEAVPLVCLRERCCAAAAGGAAVSIVNETSWRNMFASELYA